MTTAAQARQTTDPSPRIDRPTPRSLRALAVSALVQEAQLTPKPALVDTRGSGAHTDLTLSLMLRSAHALGPYFEHVAAASWSRPATLTLRAQLGAHGRLAESVMMQATGGVNTHRGAIWALGLLVAAAAQQAPPGQSLATSVAKLARLHDPGLATTPTTHGRQVIQRYGVRGAKAEAESGMPHLFHIGLPQLLRSRQHGITEASARLNALLAIMSTLEDTCILHRSGRVGLQTAQQGARHVLAQGGVQSSKGYAALLQLDAALLALRASPGGSADVLAGCLFVDALQHATTPHALTQPRRTSWKH